MKKILLYFFSIILIFSGCKNKKFDYVKISGFAQGTTYHIAYENSFERNLSVQIDSILKAFDLSVSEYIPNSIISRVNNNDSTVEADDIFKTVFNKSYEAYKNSEGAFDATVGPLVEAWGFGPNAQRSSKKSHIDSLLRYIGMEKIHLKGNKVIKKYPEMKLDFNALAQGYSVDIVCHFFDSCKIRNYLVEIGGEVRAQGKNQKGQYWRVGVDKPIDGNDAPVQIQTVLILKNKSVATSGDYRKFYIENGIKYSHHIDPHTGYPEHQNLLSASIIAKDCITADAYGTACMVMGLEKSKIFLANHPELNAYLIFSDNKGQFCEYMTEGTKEMIVH